MQDLLMESDYFGILPLSNYLRQLIREKMEVIKVNEANEKKKQETTKKEEEQEPTIDPQTQEESREFDEKWLEQFSRLTLEQAKNTTQYFDSEIKRLNQQLQELEEEKRKLFENQSNKKIMIRLNIGGKEFEVDLDRLVKLEDSIFVYTFKKMGNVTTGKISLSVINLTIRKCSIY
jgi:transcriptional regulator of heat shock response